MEFERDCLWCCHQNNPIGILETYFRHITWFNLTSCVKSHCKNVSEGLSSLYGEWRWGDLMLFWNWKSVLIVCETRLEARLIVLHKDKKLQLQNFCPFNCFKFFSFKLQICLKSYNKIIFLDFFGRAKRCSGWANCELGRRLWSCVQSQQKMAQKRKKIEPK